MRPGSLKLGLITFLPPEPLTSFSNLRIIFCITYVHRQIILTIWCFANLQDPPERVKSWCSLWQLLFQSQRSMPVLWLWLLSCFPLQMKNKHKEEGELEGRKKGHKHTYPRAGSNQYCVKCKPMWHRQKIFGWRKADRVIGSEGNYVSEKLREHPAQKQQILYRKCTFTIKHAFTFSAQAKGIRKSHITRILPIIHVTVSRLYNICLYSESFLMLTINHKKSTFISMKVYVLGIPKG